LCNVKGQESGGGGESTSKSQKATHANNDIMKKNWCASRREAKIKKYRD